jgi:hypothetical protein
MVGRGLVHAVQLADAALVGYSGCHWLRGAVGEDGAAIMIDPETDEEFDISADVKHRISQMVEAKHEQRRDSAKLYASQVRSRKPEMQVKKINQQEDNHEHRY